MDIMSMTKQDYNKELKSKILAGEEILLVDIMNRLCPGNWRVEIYTKEGTPNGPSRQYRGFFKFSSTIWPPSSPYGEGVPDLEARNCGVIIDFYEKVKIVDNYLLYKSRIASFDSREELFKLYFVEDKPVDFSDLI